MNMCGGTHQPPHTPIHPPSRAAGSPKHKSSISLELIEIFQFCVKILYPRTHIDYSWSPWTPPTYLPYPPRAKETQIRKITISIECIKIIQFCLKICDSWTLLHTYRLGMMCRWGVSYPKWHFYVLKPKKYIFFAPVTLWNQIFLFLHWFPLDHI